MSHTIGVTGHEPAVSLEEGVRRTYDWYRGPALSEGDQVSAK